MISLVALRCPQNVFRRSASILVEDEALYFHDNSSAATIRPADMSLKGGGKKEKKHHFPTRQKNKLKE